ncbi:hypothetical protein MTYP_03080 [Methylophilaceae bacterium]|nr:hypothetical protein MTYP_03080 [Methylophilaceae bacterium]
MSWPVTIYYCTACDFRQGDAGTWGRREYVLGSGVHIPVRWCVGWCESCNGIAAIEDLSHESRIQEYREAQRELHSFARRSWRQRLFGLSKWEKSLRLRYEENMEDAIDALEMLAARKSPPRCLQCLSTQVHVPVKRALSPDEIPDSPCVYSVKDEAPEKPELDHKEKSEQYVLHHPGCGGEILARMDMNGLRLALRPSVTRFTPEGVLIDKEYVRGYSAPNREHRDALSASNRQYRTLALDRVVNDEMAGSILDIPAFLRKQAD